ncbi:MAG: hypothetical protein ACM3MG_09610 [Bacillota bacterium]
MKKTKMISKIICSVTLTISPLGALASSTGVESNSTTSSQPSVNQSASNSSSSNKTGQALSYIASATEFGVAAINWSACGPHNPTPCATAALFTVMALQSLQQGNEHGNVAGASGYTADLTNAYDTGNYDSANAARTAAVGNQYLQKAQSSLRTMQGNGYINSTGTKVTSPDGKTYNVSDMTSPAAMQAAGIPKAAIDAAMETYAKIEKKAMEKLKIGAQTAANGFEEGSSGSGGIGSGDSGEGGMPVAGVGTRGLGTGNLTTRDPSSLAAGMSKNYNGEPIGVAADSIFLMMTRRYKVKESQDSFFGANDLLPKK